MFRADLIIDPKDLLCGDKLGVGAYGVVYKGKWNGPGGGTDVAIKKVKVGVVEEKHRMKIPDEVDILAKIHHENVIRIYGACFVQEDEQEMWIVTEYMDGGTLYDLLQSKERHIPWSTRLKLAHQAAKGLNALHSQSPSILHRDIKSVNFLLSKDLSKLKLIDLGLSKVSNLKSSHPRPLGSPRWGAPETFPYPPVWSTKADIYSLGCTFYEIAARQIPFEKFPDSYLSMIPESSNRPDLPPDCPKEFGDIITACWDHNSNNRPTCATVLSKLALLAESSESAPTTPRSTQVDPSIHNHSSSMHPPRPKSEQYATVLSRGVATHSVAQLRNSLPYATTSQKVLLSSIMPRFQDFKIPDKWIKTLYGNLEYATKSTSRKYQLLGYTVALSVNGEVTFTSQDLNISADPKFFKCSSSTDVFQSDGLFLLCNEKGHVGLSFDDTSSWFFFLSKFPGSKFSLYVKCNTTLSNCGDKIAILDQQCNPRLIFSSPFLFTSEKPIPQQLSWNSKKNRITVPLIKNKQPCIIAFGLANKADCIPSFPLSGIDTEGKVDEAEVKEQSDLDLIRSRGFSDPPIKRNPSQDIPKSILRSLSLIWNKFTKGDTFSVHEYTISFLATDCVEMRYKGWTLKVTGPTQLESNAEITTARTEKSRKELHLKNGDFEEVLSQGNNVVTHSLVFPTMETFYWQFHVEGNAKLEFDVPQKKITLVDKDGRAALVYQKPTVTAKEKAIIPELLWDETSNNLTVVLPDDAEPPVAFVFPIQLVLVPPSPPSPPSPTSRAPRRFTLPDETEKSKQIKK